MLALYLMFLATNYAQNFDWSLQTASGTMLRNQDINQTAMDYVVVVYAAMHMNFTYCAQKIMFKCQIYIWLGDNI